MGRDERVEVGDDGEEDEALNDTTYIHIYIHTYIHTFIHTLFFLISPFFVTSTSEWKKKDSHCFH